MKRHGINKSLFKNCLSVIENEEGVVPLRFSDKQLKAYKNFRVKSLIPSGVCLDFETDSSNVRLAYTIEGNIRDWIYFDIYLNNIFVESIGHESINSHNGIIEYSIPKMDKCMNHITIYLPHLVQLIINNIEFDEEAVIMDVEPYEKSILCLGDSITQGMDALHPSSTYPVLLSRICKMNLLNQGISGYVFNPDSLDSNMSYRPDIITVAYGTNDWKKVSSISEFQKICSEYISNLIQYYPTSKVFVITPCWRADLHEQMAGGSFFDIIKAIEDICKTYNKINIIDGLSIIPHQTRFFGDKRAHPNNEGFMHIAMNLIFEIMKA